MANYHYDEAGNMAAYFLITFLVFVLVPLTLSLPTPSKKHPTDGCQCQPCLDQRARIYSRERGSLLNPNVNIKAVIIIIGWSFFAFLAYKIAGAKLDNKVYDPFEILGLRAGVAEKEIKSHFKKLSKLYHPDKVKLSGNDTVESIANKFVEITKAYKSLTDETVRRNWELYGHPDGRQEVSMGIALPKWIIEGKNNIWVLGMYGIIFGGVLPLLVGRWWFGSRQKTKDGISALSAASFFKSLNEDSGMEDVVATLGKSYAWEYKSSLKTVVSELEGLEQNVRSKMGADWEVVRELAGAGKTGVGNEAYASRKRALVLLYAHFLRLEIGPSLQKEQAYLLLQTPILLNALLNIATSRNWLAPTLSVMRLHAYLAQALLPGKEQLKFAQLPGVSLGENEDGAGSIVNFVGALEQKGDERVTGMKKALERWGRLELVDASFKVIGERFVTPSSIVFLVVKLRIAPPGQSTLSPSKEKDTGETKGVLKMNEEMDDQFLVSKKDVEDEWVASAADGWAHAPYWPGSRKPSWWLVLADDKSNRLVVPPMKITDVPLSDPQRERDYRPYKLQFQAPNSVGLFTWKVYLVSDMFVGEDICKNIALKIDDISVLNADEHQAEDEISDPEEDSLAGQMAAMRGGAVKKSQEYDDGSDDESTTDDDKESESNSDSDSD